jgi:hypothetical protein
MQQQFHVMPDVFLDGYQLERSELIRKLMFLNCPSR